MTPPGSGGCNPAEIPSCRSSGGTDAEKKKAFEMASTVYDAIRKSQRWWLMSLSVVGQGGLYKQIAKAYLKGSSDLIRCLDCSPPRGNSALAGLPLRVRLAIRF